MSQRLNTIPDIALHDSPAEFNFLPGLVKAVYEGTYSGNDGGLRKVVVDTVVNGLKKRGHEFVVPLLGGDERIWGVFDGGSGGGGEGGEGGGWRRCAEG